MIIMFAYSNLLHGSDFLCFLFMNYYNIIIIIIIYSLFNEGDVINPTSYLTYGLRQPDGLD